MKTKVEHTKMADENTNVASLAQKINQTILSTLSPLASQLERKRAYEILEELYSSQVCADVGFYLFDYRNSNNAAIRKCGLQLVEHFIVNNWNRCNETKRNSFKLEAIKLIECAQFKEPTYLKESVVKVIVEIIKRSWPQQWETLFQDLSKLQVLGDAQLELVLIILMRLSEDINGLDSKLTTARTREMLTTLNDNMEDLFCFFLETLQAKVVCLKERIDDTTLRLAEASIFTVTAYASWVKFHHLIAKDKILFKVLFWLLEVEKLKSHACTCLSMIFERKTEHEKRVELLIILSDDALSIVKNAAIHANKTAKDCEDEYKFLRDLVEMLSIFGRCQIANLWGDDKGFDKRPDYFDSYLKLMLDFSKHDSMMIGTSAAKLWNAFFNHKLIKRDELVIAIIPELLNDIFIKMARIGNPLLPAHPATCYSVMDFDDVEDFNEAFGDTRCTMMNIIRAMTEILPHTVFQHCLSKLKEATSTPPPNISGQSMSECMMTMHYISWEALALYSKKGFSAVYFKSKKNLSPDVICACNEVLKALLDYKCDAAVFLAPVLTSIEAMFPIFKYSQEYLLQAMQMLIGLISTKSNNTDDHKIKLKRQACASFSYLCKEIPEILAQIFDDLQMYFSEQFQQDHLTNHDKAMLLEGLLSISKHIPDTNKQSEFVTKMFDFAGSTFQKENVKEALNDPVKFAEFLGLSNVGLEDDTLKSRRKELLMALYIYQAASRCFIVTNETEMNDNPNEQSINESLLKYPWIQLMIDVLPSILDVAKQFCLLWTVNDKLPTAVLSQSKIEIESVANKPDLKEDEQSGNHLQNNLLVLHGLVYTTLSHCGTCIGPSLYSLTGLQTVILEKVVYQWRHLPNYRLRKVWRFLKGFVLSCPAAYYQSIIGPILTVAMEDMLERLRVEWKKVKELVETKKQNTSNNNSNEKIEVVEERNMYNLSKEYIDIIVAFCTFKRDKDKPNVKIQLDNVNIFGKLGEFLLLNEGTNLTLICTLFTALTWPDTSVVYKLWNLLIAISKKVFLSGSSVNPEIPNQMMILLLQALQIHGADNAAHASITNAALDIYILLRERYPSLVKILLMIPSCTEEELKKFDLYVFASDEAPPENTRRKMFRKLVEGACGKTVSQLYRNNVEIKDLPPLAPRFKPNTSVLENSESGLCSFFAEDT